MAQGDFKVRFVVAGAQKCGTTALAKFLSTHPDICLAEGKEAHFFDDPARAGLDWGSDDAAWSYRSLFPAFAGQPCVVDATPFYMYPPPIAARIRRYNPEMKLIFILRAPVERTLSHFEHARRRGAERLPLSAALLVEPLRLLRDRKNFGWRSSLRLHSYTSRSRYGRQVRNMLAHFPHDRMLFLRNEELAERHDDCLRRVFEFLEVPVPDPLPAAERVFSFAHRHAVPPWVRLLIARRCRSSITELERLVGWDLGHWKNEAG